MGEKNESRNFILCFFFSIKMTKTAIGRQWMNNARLPSRPSHGCAINMECGAFESFLARCLSVFSLIPLCKLGHTAQELIYFSRHMKWSKSGVSLLGKNFTSWKTFIICICLKGSAVSSGSCSTNGSSFSLLLVGWDFVSCPVQLTLEPLVQYTF